MNVSNCAIKRNFCCKQLFFMLTIVFAAFSTVLYFVISNRWLSLDVSKLFYAFIFLLPQVSFYENLHLTRKTNKIVISLHLKKRIKQFEKENLKWKPYKNICIMFLKIVSWNIKVMTCTLNIHIFLFMITKTNNKKLNKVNWWKSKQLCFLFWVIFGFFAEKKFRIFLSKSQITEQ